MFACPVTNARSQRKRQPFPSFGRFMEPDPIGYEDGMNWYAYAHNDPVNGIDPTGLCDQPGDSACSLAPPYAGDQPCGGSTATVCGIAGGGGGCDISGGTSVDACSSGNGGDLGLSDGGDGGGGGGYPGPGPGYRPPSSYANPPNARENLCPSNSATDILGKLNALPQTAAGLILGYLDLAASEIAGDPGGTKISPGNNAIQFEGGLFGTAGEAFTLGNVTIYGPGAHPNSPLFRYNGAPTNATIGQHESGHTYQYQSKVAFPARYLGQEAIAKMRGSINPYENQADDFAESGGCR